MHIVKCDYFEMVICADRPLPHFGSKYKHITSHSVFVFSKSQTNGWQGVGLGVKGFLGRVPDRAETPANNAALYFRAEAESPGRDFLNLLGGG